jgi:hypothetical protein
MSSTPSQPASEPPAAAPGKTRTWWHPLLAGLLRWQLGSHYLLQEEVNVGKKPLQIDILLLQKIQGELPPEARRILAGLAEYLGELTLLEFKSPSDTLRAGDFQTFLAYALLYRAQNGPLLDPGKLHLVVIAPRLTEPYREELRLLGVTVLPQEPGIWRLEGGVAVHPTWVLETEVLAGVSHPLLTLFSPWILRDRLRTYDSLRQGGYADMMVYVAQQIRQFQSLGKDFAMQHLGAEDQMPQVLRDFLASLSLEERLVGISPKELLQGLSPDQLQQAWRNLLVSRSPEERLEGLSPEERLRGLSPEELERLRQLLQAQAKADKPSRPE